MEQVFEGRYAFDFTDAYVKTITKISQYVDAELLSDDIVEAVMCRYSEQEQTIYCITENDRIIVVPYSEYSIQDVKHLREYLGKKLCLRITGKCIATDASGKTVDAYTASRTLLQQEYMDSVLRKCAVRDSIINASVLSIVGDGMFVDCGFGLIAYLSLHTLSVARIPQYNYTYAKGSIIPVVLIEPVRQDNTIIVSHRELLGTWEDNASKFSIYDTCVGVVTAVQSYGVFVALTANLVGLAEYTEGVQVGQLVEVTLNRVDKYRQKIKLEIVERLPYTDLTLICNNTEYYTASYLNNIRTYGVWQYGTSADDKRDTLFTFEQRDDDFPRVYITSVAGVADTEKDFYGFVKTQRIQNKVNMRCNYAE